MSETATIPENMKEIWIKRNQLGNSISSDLVHLQKDLAEFLEVEQNIIFQLIKNNKEDEKINVSESKTDST